MMERRLAIEIRDGKGAVIYSRDYYASSVHRRKFDRLHEDIDEALEIALDASKCGECGDLFDGDDVFMAVNGDCYCRRCRP